MVCLSAVVVLIVPREIWGHPGRGLVRDSSTCLQMAEQCESYRESRFSEIAQSPKIEDRQEMDSEDQAGRVNFRR